MTEFDASSAPASEIVIGRMSEHDLLEVVNIEENSGLSRWGWAAYYAELQGPNRNLMLVARLARVGTADAEQVIGYIAARVTSDELHINNVAVRELYRGKGVGYALLSSIVEEGERSGATTAFLEVRSGNTAAQALYEKVGFEAIATRANYYSEPREDAVVMKLDLR